MKPSIYLETFGCQMNVADTERASSRLRASGYNLTDSMQSADVVILNTCSVRAKAERKVFSRIGEIRKERIGNEPLFGVAGCVAQLEGATIFDYAPVVDLVVGTRATDRLPDLIERVMSGEKKVIDIDERATGESWSVTATERRTSKIAFVPIIEGCNKFCSYCIVPFSRGRERSRLASEIVKEVLALREHGFLEVHLIGQNVNSYRPKDESGLNGISGMTPFSRLLRAVAATGMERIKFTTSFPRDFHADIVTALDENENLCNWVHLPVQSGSDSVLKAMRRGYSVADYLQRIEYVKNAKQRLSLTSDVIVGFPGESSEDFEGTLNLIKRCHFDGLYIFKYSKRSGTRASLLPENVDEKEKTERFLALETMQQGIQNHIYSSYLGSAVDVLVEDVSAKNPEDMMGHSTCHKVVNFKGANSLIGKIKKVLVTDVKANSLYGITV
jgi:tRNA-2-methylthio-N6-dimethylallyladenosine synthase